MSRVSLVECSPVMTKTGSCTNSPQRKSCNFEDPETLASSILNVSSPIAQPAKIWRCLGGPSPTSPCFFYQSFTHTLWNNHIYSRKSYNRTVSHPSQPPSGKPMHNWPPWANSALSYTHYTFSPLKSSCSCFLFHYILCAFFTHGAKFCSHLTGCNFHWHQQDFHPRN